MKRELKKRGKLTTELVGLAGEYAVASELCRRALHAHLTLGNHKKFDILVERGNGLYAGVEVKTKQGPMWPGVKGISPKGEIKFLVLVDLAKTELTDRPNFYVLDQNDWGTWLRQKLKGALAKGTVTIDEDNVSRWNGYDGEAIKPDEVKEFEEQWQKVTAAS
jgi:hypothetical protein